MPTPEIIAHLSRDPVLARVVEKHSLEDFKHHEIDLFEHMTRVIIYQQLSGKAADTIHGRYMALFEDRPYAPGTLLELEHETLRSVGLSNNKARYVKHIAEYFQGLENPEDLHELEDEHLLKELTSIKGIGAWTAKITLLGYFRRPDILPVEDLTIRQVIAELYQLEGTGKELIARIEEVAEPWRPYRSYACRYFWAWRDGG